jgi:hypothetical protein
MEPENHKVINNNINEDEVNLILEWIDGLRYEGRDANHHLSEMSKYLKGNSFIFDISQTEITQFITKFQSISNVSTEKLPEFINEIINRVAQTMNFPTDNIFLQVVDMCAGGKINPHYDASIFGYVNYKCNISVLSENYDIHIGDEHKSIQSRDLYGFEASLYKHWTDEFNSRRVFLSLGFMLPYSTLGRTKDDPRCRLSQRIQKYFQA